MVAKLSCLQAFSAFKMAMSGDELTTVVSSLALNAWHNLRFCQSFVYLFAGAEREL